jgi:hypothetical protein
VAEKIGKQDDQLYALGQAGKPALMGTVAAGNVLPDGDAVVGENIRDVAEPVGTDE